jgi:RNA-binding protein YhbY
MTRKTLPTPLLQYLEPITNYVEKDAEITKSTLLSRIAGKVEYSVLQIIKQLVFYKISKNENNELTIA